MASRSLRSVVLLAGIAVLVMTPLSFAQWAPGLEHPGHGRWWKNIVETLPERLDMTPEQKAWLDEAYPKHVAELHRREMEMRESAAQEREAIQAIPAVADQEREHIRIAKYLSAHADRQRQADAAFETAFRGILSDEQQTKLQRIIAEQNRYLLSQVQQSAPGSKVDLMEVIGGLELDPDTLARMMIFLEPYAVERDRRIIRVIEDEIKFCRELWRSREVNHECNEIYRRMGFTPEAEAAAKQVAMKNSRLWSDRHKSQVELALFNKSFATQVMTELPEESRSDFSAALKLAMYPDAYARSLNIDRYVDKLRNMTSLSPARKEEIEREWNAYLEARAKLGDSIAESIDRRFDSQRREPGNNRLHGEQLNATQKLITERYEFDSAFLDRLFQSLSSSQQAEAPKPRVFSSN